MVKVGIAGSILTIVLLVIFASVVQAVVTR
jgi:hypothetical protein